MPPIVPPRQQHRRGPENDLHRAACRGWTDRMTSLLSTGSINIDHGDPAGWTPLLFAAQKGNSSIISMLLCKKANVLIAADDGVTPLHMSAQNGHLAVTICLVEAGADPEAKTCQGATPLHMATQLGHSEVMAVLIEAGADVNCRSEGGRTPLYLAAQVGHLAAVKELLRAKADPLLALASSRDAIPIPLEIAALSGHSEVVRELVQHVGIAGCGGESGGAEALEGAAVESHLDIMAVLADAGVVDAGNALHSAAGCGREVAVKFLLQHRPRGPTSDGGGYVNCRDGYGSTPLIRAIDGYSREAGKPHLIYPKVARALIDAGADTSSAVHATNQWGKVLFKGTPLAFTNRCLRLKKVRWLEEDATEEQLHRLEAVRRLLLRVEAVHAVSWLWHRKPLLVSDVTEVSSRRTSRKTAASGTQLASMLSILRRRKRGALLEPLFRYSSYP